MINTQCNSCNEPTKFPTGFWDGINNKHGCLYDCKNANCPVKQTANANAEKKRKQQQQIIQTNHNNDVDVKHIIALRQEKHITMYKMAKTINCGCAEYSSYEHERKPFPKELYQKCLDYLKSI